MENKGEELHMPFLEHLGELRGRLLRSLIAIGVGFLVAYAFAKPIFRVLMQPFDQAYRNVFARDPEMIVTGLMESFLVYLKVGLIAGLFLASPYIFYQVWRFIAPGLRATERKHGLRFVLLATVMFVGGGLFGYFGVFPIGFTYFLQVTQGEAIDPMIRMQEYFQISAWMLIVFGLVFEMPLLVMYLVFFGLIQPEQLSRSWRTIIVGIFLGAALLTPADPGSMLLMALPMMALYGLTVVFSRFVAKRRPAKNGEKRGQEPF